MKFNSFAAIAVCLVAMATGVAPVCANPVNLPFSESFDTPSNDASFATNYPAFTTTGTLARTVDAGGILRLGSGTGNPAMSWTSVTPTPAPAGGILIKVDMGYDGGAG